MQGKRNKKLDNEINRLYGIHGNNVEINIMDISKIFKACYAAFAAVTSVEDAMKAAIAAYRKN